MTRDEEIEAAWKMHEGGTIRQRSDRTPDVRNRLAEAQNWRCAHCGGRMDGTKMEPDAPTFEHIVPRSKGGPDVISNFVIVHHKCNVTRGVAPILIEDDHVT